MRLLVCQAMQRDWREVHQWPAPVFDEAVALLSEQAEERDRIINRAKR